MKTSVPSRAAYLRETAVIAACGGSDWLMGLLRETALPLTLYITEKHYAPRAKRTYTVRYGIQIHLNCQMPDGMVGCQFLVMITESSFVRPKTVRQL